MRNKKWVRLLAYVTGSVNQELLLQNEYLATENRILRAKLPSRLRLSNPERATLAEIAKRLGRKALREVACVAKPDTILAWYRRLVAEKFDGSKHRQYPFAPRGLPLPVEPLGGLDTAGAWNHQTSRRQAFDTKPGWCRAWRHRQPLGVLCGPGASRSRPGWRARDCSTAISMAVSPSEYDSPQPDIHSAAEAPGSPSPSRTPAVAPTSCSSCRSSILLWPR